MPDNEIHLQTYAKMSDQALSSSFEKQSPGDIERLFNAIFKGQRVEVDVIKRIVCVLPPEKVSKSCLLKLTFLLGEREDTEFQKKLYLNNRDLGRKLYSELEMVTRFLVDRDASAIEEIIRKQPPFHLVDSNGHDLFNLITLMGQPKHFALLLDVYEKKYGRLALGNYLKERQERLVGHMTGRNRWVCMAILFTKISRLKEREELNYSFVAVLCKNQHIRTHAAMLFALSYLNTHQKKVLYSAFGSSLVWGLFLHDTVTGFQTAVKELYQEGVKVSLKVPPPERFWS